MITLISTVNVFYRVWGIIVSCFSGLSAACLFYFKTDHPDSIFSLIKKVSDHSAKCSGLPKAKVFDQSQSFFLPLAAEVQGQTFGLRFGIQNFLIRKVSICSYA